MDVADLTSSTAAELAQEIAEGSVSAEKVTAAFLDRIEAADKEVRAFVHLDPDDALAQAKALDERRRSGLAIGPLHGVPVAIKDVIDVAGFPCEWGSPVFAGRRPWSNSTVAAKLRAAGAVLIGKTVTTEFAYFHPGPTKNPHDLTRTPGGSSSGSAAAVAAGMVPLSIGTQTNGSMIRPASFCGVYGIKPSHGLVSRAGSIEHSRTLDHIGAFARTIGDLAIILEVIAGFDPLDADTRPFAVPNFYSVAAEEPPLPPRFAFVKTPVWERADAATRSAFEKFAASLGDSVETVDLPAPFDPILNLVRRVMSADMAQHHAQLEAHGGDKTSKVFRDFLAEGRKVTAFDYLDALEKGRLMNVGLAKVFEQYDAIITPATTGVAPKGHETTGDPAFCSLWSLTGLPALSLPLLRGEAGLPLGVQLVGQAGDDARLMRTASWLVAKVEEQ